MKNSINYSILTEHFFEGETTLEEETLLYEFYQQRQLPAELLPYQQLFNDLAALPVTGTMSENQVSYSPNTVSQTVSRRFSLSKIRYQAFKWAAVLLLLFGGGVLSYDYFHQSDEYVVLYYGQTVNDQGAVLAELEHTLNLMDWKGDDVAEELNDMFHP